MMEEIARNAETRVYPKFKARIYQIIKSPGMDSTVEGQDRHSRGWQSLEYLSLKVSENEAKRGRD